MNRRTFLTALGTSLATYAIVTKLGQSSLPKIPSMEGDFDVAALRYKATERFSRSEFDPRALEDLEIELRPGPKRIILPRPYEVDVQAVRRLLQ